MGPTQWGVFKLPYHANKYSARCESFEEMPFRRQRASGINKN